MKKKDLMKELPEYKEIQKNQWPGTAYLAEYEKWEEKLALALKEGNNPISKKENCAVQ